MTLSLGRIVSPVGTLVVMLGVGGRVSAVSVRHEPPQPKPGVPVLVTAELPAGTAQAVLKLQAVAPGKYVRKADPAYERDCVDPPMRDDGKEGDARARDSVFSVRVPAAWQKHRWLLRYRIATTDGAGKASR